MNSQAKIRANSKSSNNASVKVSTRDTLLVVMSFLTLLPGNMMMIFGSLYLLYVQLLGHPAAGFSSGFGYVLSVSAGLLGTFGSLLVTRLMWRLILSWTKFVAHANGTVTLKYRRFLNIYSCTFSSERVVGVGVTTPDVSAGSEDIWYWVYIALDNGKSVCVMKDCDYEKAVSKARELIDVLGIDLPKPKVNPAGTFDFQSQDQVLAMIKTIG
jgi:hypothetical protein